MELLKGVVNRKRLRNTELDEVNLLYDHPFFHLYAYLKAFVYCFCRRALMLNTFVELIKNLLYRVGQKKLHPWTKCHNFFWNEITF